MAFAVECRRPWSGRAYARCRIGSSYVVTLLPFWDTHSLICGRAPRRRGQVTHCLSSGPCSPRPSRRVSPALVGLDCCLALDSEWRETLFIRDTHGFVCSRALCRKKKGPGHQFNLPLHVGWTSWLQSDGPGRPGIAYVGCERLVKTHTWCLGSMISRCALRIPLLLSGGR
jgi:hypothetical protein